MFSLVVDNLLLLWGVVASFYGAQRLARHGGIDSFAWLLAGLVTVAVIILDHTILIDLALAGDRSTVGVVKGLTDTLLVVVWLYIAYRETRSRRS
jgi:hypothetical protein